MGATIDVNLLVCCGSKVNAEVRLDHQAFARRIILVDAIINLAFAGLCVFELAFLGFNVGTLIGVISTTIISFWAMSILLRAELIFARGGRRVVLNYFYYSW